MVSESKDTPGEKHRSFGKCLSRPTHRKMLQGAHTQGHTQSHTWALRHAELVPKKEKKKEV